MRRVTAFLSGARVERRHSGMSSTGKKERLSPPLMHAFRSAFEARDSRKKLDLRDESGERVIATRRTSARVAITEPTLRREVARDLDALMNTIALESTQDLRSSEHVRKSILNFGFPDITHRSIDEISVNDVSHEIATVLMHYEPRLVRDTVQVSRDSTVDSAELKVRFIVRADLACEPLNVPIEFVADVEIDSGKIVINRL
jgi:type VI secretion system protein ImpF